MADDRDELPNAQRLAELREQGILPEYGATLLWCILAALVVLVPQLEWGLLPDFFRKVINRRTPFELTWKEFETPLKVFVVQISLAVFMVTFFCSALHTRVLFRVSLVTPNLARLSEGAVERPSLFSSILRHLVILIMACGGAWWFGGRIMRALLDVMCGEIDPMGVLTLVASRSTILCFAALALGAMSYLYFWAGFIRLHRMTRRQRQESEE